MVPSISMTYMNNPYSSEPIHSALPGGSYSIDKIDFKLSTLRTSLELKFFFRPGYEGLSLAPRLSFNWIIQRTLEHGQEKYDVNHTMTGSQRTEVFSQNQAVRNSSVSLGLGIGWTKQLTEKNKLDVQLIGEYDFGFVGDNMFINNLPKVAILNYMLQFGWTF
jgi:hypothetical protein